MLGGEEREKGKKHFSNCQYRNSTAYYFTNKTGPKYQVQFVCAKVQIQRSFMINTKQMTEFYPYEELAKTT